MIAGSSMSPIYYNYYCEDTHSWRNFYLTAQILTSGSVFTVSLWDKFDKPQYRVFRGTLFVMLGLLSAVPFIHQAAFVSNRYLPHLDLYYWIFGGILYIVGATIYMLRLPERFFPGLFDIFGSSHQIFHIFIVIAAVMTYYAALQSFYNR
jgi:adiponectin receptor